MVLLRTILITLKIIYLHTFWGIVKDFCIKKKLKQLFSYCIIMNRLGPDKEKTIEENIITNVRNLFKLKRENKAIEERIIRDIRNLLS